MAMRCKHYSRYGKARDIETEVAELPQEFSYVARIEKGQKLIILLFPYSIDDAWFVSVCFPVAI